MYTPVAMTGQYQLLTSVGLLFAPYQQATFDESKYYSPGTDRVFPGDEVTRVKGVWKHI